MDKDIYAKRSEQDRIESLPEDIQSMFDMLRVHLIRPINEEVNDE